MALIGIYTFLVEVHCNCVKLVLSPLEVNNSLLVRANVFLLEQIQFRRGLDYSRANWQSQIFPANTQRGYNVIQRRCNVTTLQRRCNDVACLLGLSSWQAHNAETTLIQRQDVESTLFQRCVLAGFLL